MSRMKIQSPIPSWAMSILQVTKSAQTNTLYLVNQLILYLAPHIFPSWMPSEPASTWRVLGAPGLSGLVVKTIYWEVSDSGINLPSGWGPQNLGLPLHGQVPQLLSYQTKRQDFPLSNSCQIMIVWGWMGGTGRDGTELKQHQWPQHSLSKHVYKDKAQCVIQGKEGSKICLKVVSNGIYRVNFSHISATYLPTGQVDLGQGTNQ